jgi:hypothetical protein
MSKVPRSPQLSRREFLIRLGTLFGASALISACAAPAAPPIEAPIRLPSVRDPETLPPEINLFTLSIGQQHLKVIDRDLKDATDFPHTDDTVYSYRKPHQDRNFEYWLIAERSTAAGALLHQAIDSKSPLIIDNHTAEHAGTYTLRALSPTKGDSDFLSYPPKDNSAQNPITATQLYNFMQNQHKEGYITIILQTCFTIDGNPSGGREFAVYYVPQKALLR